MHIRYTQIGVAALLPLLALGEACSHTIAPSARPAPPPVASAPPSFGALTQETSRPPESQLPLSFKTDLTPIQRAIQRALPERITEAGHPLGQDFRWTFVRDGEPDVTIQDGLVAFHATYHGDIETRGSSRACRLDPLYPTLDGAGKLVQTQNGDNLVFRFEPTQVTTGLKPESDARCNMFNGPVKDQLRELFNLPMVTNRLASAVDPATFAIPMKQLWQTLHGPLAVSVPSLNTNVCLYGKPQELVIGNSKGTVTDTTMRGIVREMPTVAYQTVCQEPMTTMAKLSSGAVPAEAKPFTMLAAVAVPYSVLNHELQNKLFHQTLALDTTFGDKVVIERASASDANGRVLLTVQTSGAVDGTIYYWGTPQLQDGGKVLAIPDLQMANESKTALDSVKVGYWQLVDRELRDRLRQAATIDLSSQVERMKTALTGQHKSGDLTMDILVARQRPEQARSTPQGLMAYLVLEGTANATGNIAVEHPGRSTIVR